MIYLILNGDLAELVDSERQAVIARGHVEADGPVPDGGKVEVGLRFVGEMVGQ